jgi:hypothetical protein
MAYIRVAVAGRRSFLFAKLRVRISAAGSNAC